MIRGKGVDAREYCLGYECEWVGMVAMLCSMF